MPNTNRPQSAAEQRAYRKRVRELESEGLCTSDAQAVIDAEEMKAAQSDTKPQSAYTPRYTLEAGRSILCNGVPFATIHGTKRADGSYDPVTLDTFARDVVRHANERDALRERVRALEGALRTVQMAINEALTGFPRPITDYKDVVNAALRGQS